MKKIILFTIAAAFTVGASAQKYFTKTGYIGFFSKTAMEDIKADNNKVSTVLDAATGQVEFSALVKAFAFEKALMEEHFNENYMESSTFPKATFKGKVENMSAINLKKDGSYASKVSGELTIHGVTKTITSDATFDVKGDMITAQTKFFVNPEDYQIEIPEVVKDKISKNIEVTVLSKLEPLKK